MKVSDLKTGYIFLIASTTELGKAISEFEEHDHNPDPEWNHSGVTLLDYDDIKVVEMEADGSEENFINKYKGVKMLICIPKYKYDEAEAYFYLKSKVGKIKYNFAKLGLIAVKILTLGFVDLTKIKSNNDICSEFSLQFVNYISHGLIPDWEGKEPANIANMPELFTYIPIEWDL